MSFRGLIEQGKKNMKNRQIEAAIMAFGIALQIADRNRHKAEAKTLLKKAISERLRQ